MRTPDERAPGPAEIVGRNEVRVSPWVRLVEKQVRFAPGEPVHSYHCIAQADYVAIVARTPSGLFPIVRQFRPAVESYTWELPAGLLEQGEDPEQCCRRELLEEVGLIARSVSYLGTSYPDTGRLANRQHVYFVEASEPDPGFVPEPGIETAFLPLPQLKLRIRSQQFIHQLHVASLYLYEMAAAG